MDRLEYYYLDNDDKLVNLFDMLSNFHNITKVVYDGQFLCRKVVDTWYGLCRICLCEMMWT